MTSHEVKEGNRAWRRLQTEEDEDHGQLDSSCDRAKSSCPDFDRFM
jgi:hypothetical protein